MARARMMAMWDGVSLLASIIANVAGNKTTPESFHPFLKEGKSSGISGASYSRRGVRKNRG